MRSIALCEAKCSQCNAVFAHASLGDFAYGEAVFATDDGQQFVVANANSNFAKQVSSLVPPEPATCFWSILAALADPVNGKQLTYAIVCPNCRSTSVAYWGGQKVGAVAEAEATFEQFSALGELPLSRRIAEILELSGDA
jgi:hypothetical protein